MRIVDRTEFLAMPSGTVFAKWEPCIFGPMAVKGPTWPECNDFLVHHIDSLEGDPAESCFALEAGQDVPLDFDNFGRDGCFDDAQLFAVWSDADVDGLIKLLQNRHTL